MPEPRPQRRQGELGEVHIFQPRRSIGAAAIPDAANDLVAVDYHESTRQRGEHWIIPVLWSLMSTSLVFFPPGHETQRVPLEDGGRIRFAVSGFHVSASQSVHPCTGQQVTELVHDDNGNLAVLGTPGLEHG